MLCQLQKKLACMGKNAFGQAQLLRSFQNDPGNYFRGTCMGRMCFYNNRTAAASALERYHPPAVE